MIFEMYTSYPPTVNNYYVKTQRGVFISQKGKKFRDQVIQDVCEQLAGFEKQYGRLRLDVVLFVPDKRRRDIDNVQKPLLDALTHAGVWDDDSQLDQITIYRGAHTFDGKTYIRVSEAGPIIPIGMEKLLDSGE